ncbi:MAG: hypothetical protein F4X72_12155 [Dehalococcoidia bacterium]|nr:hypothetical protein [Dehalococcoidia bacterium]
MTDTFETTLVNIISQKSDFESRDEKAVEMAVVLPLLRQVGWNTENVSEIYPQRETSDGGKVDFDLQIAGESRILIEVKRWKHNLDEEDEEQLTKYCQSTKPTRPKLAVLTSGRVWRLYLAPTANKGNNSELKRFEEVDVIADELSEIESYFRQFLARDSMVDFRPTMRAAKDLYRKVQDFQEQKRLLTKAWNELTNDRDTLTELVLSFAEIKNIQTNPDNVLRFLDSLQVSLVNEVPTKAKSRTKMPASFVLPTSPASKGNKPQQLKNRSGWYNLLSGICELMQSRHPDSFHQNTLSMTDRFAENQNSKFSKPVGDVGIYAKKQLRSGEIKDTCDMVVTKFGYPEDSLTILDSNGVRL